jgi:hypothetical protein
VFSLSGDGTARHGRQARNREAEEATLARVAESEAWSGENPFRRVLELVGAADSGMGPDMSRFRGLMITLRCVLGFGWAWAGLELGLGLGFGVGVRRGGAIDFGCRSFCWFVRAVVYVHVAFLDTHHRQDGLPTKHTLGDEERGDNDNAVRAKGASFSSQAHP